MCEAVIKFHYCAQNVIRTLKWQNSFNQFVRFSFKNVINQDLKLVERPYQVARHLVN